MWISKKRYCETLLTAKSEGFNHAITMLLSAKVHIRMHPETSAIEAITSVLDILERYMAGEGMTISEFSQRLKQTIKRNTTYED